MNNKKIDAIIYKPSKTAMQSGYMVKDFWELKFIHNSKVMLDPIMGWSGSKDTRKQILLRFDTCDDAINYANKKNISYRVIATKKKNIKPKSYADNFSFNRKGLWTH